MYRSVERKRDPPQIHCIPLGMQPRDVQGYIGRKTMYKDIFRVAFEGTLDDVRFFIEQGTDVNVRNDLGKTPLHVAAGGYSRADVVQYLIEKGADVNAQDIFGGTPLCQAFGSIDKMVFLIEKGANVNDRRDCMGWTPLHFAARHPNVDVVKCLINHGAEIHATDNKGWTPLHHAAGFNHNTKTVKYLIEVGANINAISDAGETPLDVIMIAKKKKRALFREAGGKTGEELSGVIP